MVRENKTQKKEASKDYRSFEDRFNILGITSCSDSLDVLHTVVHSVTKKPIASVWYDKNDDGWNLEHYGTGISRSYGYGEQGLHDAEEAAHELTNELGRSNCETIHTKRKFS